MTAEEVFLTAEDFLPGGRAYEPPPPELTPEQAAQMAASNEAERAMNAAYLAANPSVAEALARLHEHDSHRPAVSCPCGTVYECRDGGHFRLMWSRAEPRRGSLERWGCVCPDAAGNVTAVTRDAFELAGAIDAECLP